MGVGEDWVCFDAEKEYVGEEDEVLWQDWTKLDMADASQLATDWKRWRELIKSHNSADSAT